MSDSTEGKTPEPKKKARKKVAKSVAKKKTTKKKGGTPPKQTPGVKTGAGNKPFTEKQLAFMDFYVAYRNATKAAREAGYSERGASVEGHRLLADPKIREEISRRQEDLKQNTSLTPENLLEKLKEFIFERAGAKDSDKLKAIQLAGSYFGMWDGLGKPENGSTNRSNVLARFRKILGETK